MEKETISYQVEVDGKPVAQELCLKNAIKQLGQLLTEGAPAAGIHQEPLHVVMCKTKKEDQA